MRLQKIKQTDLDLLEKLERQVQYAFYPSPGSKKEIEKFRRYNRDTITLAILHDDEIVATGAVSPITQNIRGKLLRMGGVANIVSYPEFRRQGHIKRIMKELFTEMYKEKYAVTTLYPFRQSFYGKMGYITLPQARTAVIQPQNLQRILKLSITGKYERGELRERINDYVAFKKRMTVNTHGFAYFTDTKMQQYKELAEWIVIAKVQEQVVGMLTYKISGFEGKMNIREFMYANASGKYLMLKWIALHVDQVKEITIPLFPFERLELWQNDMKAQICSRKWVPSAMARILNINELKGIKVGTGSFVVNINDPLCEWNNGTWKFSSAKGKLKVEKVKQQAQQIKIQALSALVFGAYEVSDFEYLGWGNIDKETKNKMQLLFPPIVPALNVQF